MNILRIGCIVCLIMGSQWAYAAESRDDIVAKMGSFELKRDEIKKMAEAQGIVLKDNKQAKRALEQLARLELIRRAVLVEAKRAQWEKSQTCSSKLSALRNKWSLQAI